MDIRVARASGRAEREQAIEMIRHVRRRHWIHPRTLGADKGYDDGKFFKRLEEEFGVVPHVPVRRGKIKSQSEAGEARRRAKRRQSTQGYRNSQRVRKRVEEIFGWLKTVGGLRKTRFVGRWKTQLYAHAAAAGLNFLRLANLESG